MGDKGFKPETMRVFVRLDEDGEYHEVKNVSEVGISEESDWETNASIGTITLSGLNLHTSNDSYRIEKAPIKPPKSSVWNDKDCCYTYSADSPIFYAAPTVHFKLLSKRDDYKRHLPKKVIVSGPCVISLWKDGTKTISRCHDSDEMDVRTGILLNAIKKWMPGGTYWYDAIDDVTVEYQSKKETVEKPVHEPVNHDHPKRPYQRGMSYSDDEKLAALEMMEHMPVTQVSKKTGISLSCLYRWRDMFRSGND